ncbi:MAG: hypothetical protein GY755_15470 [Chloroflexi bacterium]|nr:hypothetical protein [Chloroflexota bacterium]
MKLSEINNETATQGRTWISLGRILWQENPPQVHKAEESIAKGIEILQDLKAKALYSPGYLYLGELYLNLGEKEKAAKNLKKAEDMFQEMGMDYSGQWGRPLKSLSREKTPLRKKKHAVFSLTLY